MSKSAVRYIIIQTLATSLVAYCLYVLLAARGVPSYRNDPAMREYAFPIWADAFLAGIFSTAIAGVLLSLNTVPLRWALHTNGAFDV